jgi:hypothetical protein
MKKAYYAHAITLFNSLQEKEDIELIVNLGFEVVNPNSEEHTAGYEKHGMEYFYQIIKNCDLILFRAFPDGAIPSGIHKEISYAQRLQKIVLELPNLIDNRALSVTETKDYLKITGRR